MGKRKAPPGRYWRDNVLWGRIQAGGKDIRWSLGTDDPQVAANRRRKERGRQIAITRFGDDRKTYAGTVDAWAERMARNVAPRTATRYLVSLGQLDAFLSGLHLDEIDGTLIGSIVDSRMAAGVTNATIKRDLGALSSVLKFAQVRKWRADNPARDHLGLISERRQPILLPSPQDIRHVMDRAPGMIAALIEAAWLTGCRLDELVSAKRHQLDLGRRELTVVGKRSRLRVLDVGDWGFELFRSLPVSLEKPWLFWHHDGLPYRTASGQFKRLVTSVARQAQKQAQQMPKAAQAFRPFRFHGLRHRNAVDWLKSGRSIYDLQQRLGHTSVKTTEIYLAYLTAEEQRVAKFGRAAEGTKSGT
jgi:integrase/recombinase XerD